MKLPKKISIKIALLFPLSLFWSYSLLAQNESKKIREGIKRIQEHSKKSRPLLSNPLAGLNFLSYQSQGHLLFYRGLGYSLIGQGKKGEQKLSYLNMAFNDLKQIQSLSYPYMEKQRTEELIRQMTQEIIQESFARKMYFSVIRLIEGLSPQEQKRDQWVLYYGQALYESKQFTSLTRLVNQFPEMFQNKALIKGLLRTPPRWDRLITQSLEKFTSNHLLMPSSSVTPMTSNVQTQMEPLMDPLQNPQQTFSYLKKNIYFKNSYQVFKNASELYFSLREKETKSAAEEKFTQGFLKNMVHFSPSMLEELITKFWKKKELQKAATLSETFLKKYYGHPSYPKILYDLGRLREDARKYSQAYKAFQTFLQTSDDVGYEETVLFRVGWMAYLMEKSKEAAPLFERYLASFPEGKYASTCEYFLLKIAPSPANIQSERVKAYLQKYPLNLYSLILMDEGNLPSEDLLKLLSSLPSLKQLEIKHSLFKADIATLTLLKVYRELKSFGLKDEAWKLLLQHPLDEKNDLFLLHLAAEFEDLDYIHGRSFSLTRIFSTFPHMRQQIPWRGLFPDFKVDLIKEILAEQKVSLSPFLILALIRQESAFNSQARSPADAYGLMQLIQPTAQGVASRLNLTQFDLFKEKDNLQLGIGNLAALIKKYQGRIDYALSAYNAGEMITGVWIELRGHLPPLEFIESIPYNETRQYIKNVLRNYSIYQLLYDSDRDIKGRRAPLVHFTASLGS